MDTTNKPAPEAATETTLKKPRGFAALSQAQRSEISARGGRAAHAKGVAHQFTKEKAREAGRKGGRASHARRGE